MSLSVCVLIGACSPVTTAPCVKKNVEYSVEAPEPVVGISSETIILKPPNVSTTLGPSKALVVLPPVASQSGAPVLS